MVLGLAIYFGINSNSTGKTVVINNANQEPEVVVDPGFVITKQNESLIVKNDDYNYELTLPKDWQQYEDSNSGQIIFYSGDVEIQGVGTELSKGMKLDILIEPADQGLTLVENIESFFSQIENYE